MSSRALVGCVAVVVALATIRSGPTLASAKPDWKKSFEVDTGDLKTEGVNRYFVLRPGYRLTLEGQEHGKAVRLVITVLDETKLVGGVETRVVEERETSGDLPIEVSRNYFAISARTNDVFYFGEDVDTYKHGRLNGHEGGWHHGTDNAHFGLAMPGAPAVGSRYYQEVAPGVAMDRAEVRSLSARVTTPAGVFTECLETKETSPLEPFAKEGKLYAPGIGLIRDGSLSLVSYDPVRP